MALKFKPYDPSRQKQRAERRRHAKLRERTELSPSGPSDEERLSGSTPRCSADDGDCSPIGESDIIRDPLANFPSEEECLSLCFPATDVSSASTPASACSLGYKMDHFVLRWDSQDSAIDVEDNRPDSSSDTAISNTPDATPRAVLHGGDLCRGWESTDSISDDTYAQMASASELNNGLLAQNAEALGILASAASAEQESASGISSSASIPGPGTQAFATKRPLLNGDVPGESEGHDSEIYRSPKRSRRSDFNLHSSPRLESDDICPISPRPCVGRGVDQSSQVPEDFGPQFRPGFHVDPSLIAPDHPSSQWANPMSLPTEQAESTGLGSGDPGVGAARVYQVAANRSLPRARESESGNIEPLGRCNGRRWSRSAQRVRRPRPTGRPCRGCRLAGSPPGHGPVDEHHIHIVLRSRKAGGQVPDAQPKTKHHPPAALPPARPGTPQRERHPKLCQFIGEEGTKKTRVIAAVTELFARAAQSHYLLVTATSGTAAANINGITTHSAGKFSKDMSTSAGRAGDQTSLRLLAR
ncbi:hypothetical protein AUP68_05472 [Ilyonectria robusta]